MALRSRALGAAGRSGGQERSGGGGGERGGRARLGCGSLPRGPGGSAGSDRGRGARQCVPPRYSLFRTGKPRCHRSSGVSLADAAFGSSPVLASVGPQLLFGSHFHGVCAFPKGLNASQMQNDLVWKIRKVDVIGNEVDCLRGFALNLKIVRFTIPSESVLGLQNGARG